MWYYILNLCFPVECGITFLIYASQLTWLFVWMTSSVMWLINSTYYFQDFIVLCTIWKYVPDFLVLLIFIFFFKLLSHSGCTELLSVYTVTELMPLFVTVGHWMPEQIEIFQMLFAILESYVFDVIDMLWNFQTCWFITRTPHYNKWTFSFYISYVYMLLLNWIYFGATTVFT